MSSDSVALAASWRETVEKCIEDVGQFLSDFEALFELFESTGTMEMEVFADPIRGMPSRKKGWGQIRSTSLIRISVTGFFRTFLPRHSQSQRVPTMKKPRQNSHTTEFPDLPRQSIPPLERIGRNSGSLSASFLSSESPTGDLSRDSLPANLTFGNDPHVRKHVQEH